MIPINIERWADRITQSLNRRSIAVTWSQLEGDPVALITVPIRYTGEEEMEVKVIEVEENRIVLVGETILESSVTAELDSQTEPKWPVGDKDKNSNEQD